MAILALYAFGSVILVSLLSLIGAATFLFHRDFLQRILFFLVSLAVGAFFGDAILHLIPESFESLDPTVAGAFVLAGILGFLALEKFLRWRHEHGHGTAEDHADETIALAEGGGRIKPLGYLVLASDGIHNFVDGIIIAASYFVSIEVGIATTIAVVLHEIPNELSDFGILIHAGFSKARALFMNFLSALLAVAGAALVFLIGGTSETFIPAMIAFGGGAFLYIAGSDLVPELHKTSNLRHSLLQFIAILIGVGIMFALLLFEA